MLMQEAEYNERHQEIQIEKLEKEVGLALHNNFPMLQDLFL